jgi:hypothetical protein
VKTGAYKTGLSPEQRKDFEDYFKADLSPRASNKFWHDFRVTFTDKNEKIFDLSDKASELEYLIMRQHSAVAVSHDDLAKNPNKRYVIFDQVKEAESTNSKARVKAQAWKIFSGLSAQKIKDFLILLGNRAYNLNKEIAESKLAEIVERNPAKIVEIDGIDSKRRSAMLNFQRMIDQELVTKKGNSFYYDGEMIGHDYEMALGYLLNPQNQSLYLALVEGVKERTK